MITLAIIPGAEAVGFAFETNKGNQPFGSFSATSISEHDYAETLIEALGNHASKVATILIVTDVPAALPDDANRIAGMYGASIALSAVLNAELVGISWSRAADIAHDCGFDPADRAMMALAVLGWSIESRREHIAFGEVIRADNRDGDVGIARTLKRLIKSYEDISDIASPSI